MKKIVIIMLTVSFYACGGSSKIENTINSTQTVEEIEQQPAEVEAMEQEVEKIEEKIQKVDQLLEEI